MVELTVDLKLDVITCPICGMSFGMSQRWSQERRRDHASFFCPAGHRQFFPAETEAEQLRRQLKEMQEDVRYTYNRLQQEEEEHKATRRTLGATRGQLTKAKKRVQAGRCLYCQKQYSHLKHHMEVEHPGYAEQDDIDVASEDDLSEI